MSRLARVVITVCVASLPVLLYAFNSGPPARYTGAPGDFGNCTACHGGTANTHGGNVTATFSSGTTYTPGSPVTITVNVTDASNSLHGFEMTARLASNLANGQAGRFTQVPGTFVICENEQFQGAACPQNAPVSFIEQSSKTTGTWTFTWTPPATNVGNVHFYIAGNAVNNNGSADSGDHVYTNSYVLTPAVACDTPVINGIQSAGEFGARQDFTAGSWLEVYGQHLSTTTGDWNDDFQGNNAPTSVDGVSAMVNGQPATIWFISPGQMNIQAPGLEATGPVNITVTDSRLTGCPATSQPSILTQKQTAPGMLAKVDFVVNAKQYLTAWIGNSATVVGNIPNYVSRPVHSGETILAYGIGFGSANPFFAPGTIATQLNRITGNLQVTIGGVPLQESSIAYAGLAPGFIGLYQFNLVIPQLPDGDHQVVVALNGVPLPQTFYITVQN